MNRRSVSARAVLGLCLALSAALGMTGCHTPLYYYTENQFAGRAIPPSGLQQRVLAAYTVNGSSGSGGSGGGAEILDGLRDLRNNVQNTHPSFAISGFSPGLPIQITNYPEEQMGYVLDQATGAYTSINYATERAGNTIFTLGTNASSATIAPDGTRAVGVTAAVIAGNSTNNTNQVEVYTTTATYTLNLPNVVKVAMNPGNTVMLAMTRNSNNLYRIIQLPQTNYPQPIPGAVDCEPLLLPQYCIVPVKGTFDRPTAAYFSLDGNTVDILNAGPEAGGTTAGVSVLSVASLTYNNIPTVDPLSSGAASSMASLPVSNPVAIPGGVTAALSDGTNLYLSGQSLYRPSATGALTTTPASDGLFAGYLTVLPLSTYVPGNPVSISDGTHTRMLFADDNTLWVGANNCAVGERAHNGQNINCLTMLSLAGTTPVATIVPAVTPGGTVTVAFPNTNGNLYYYGDLTGLCWVQNYHKVFTAYGGQVHAFYTGGAITDINDPAHGTTPGAGTEVDNTNFTVQGTVLDVAYMDALTNAAN